MITLKAIDNTCYPYYKGYHMFVNKKKETLLALWYGENDDTRKSFSKTKR